MTIPRVFIPHFRGIKAASILLLLLVLTACSSVGGRTGQINRAENQWQSQNITSYTIEVQDSRSIWHLQANTVTVHDGIPTESFAACTPTPFEGGTCDVEDFDPADYTVAALFDIARRESQRGSAYLTLEFDSTYGFPSLIAFDDPDILDEDWALSVTAFQPLP